MQMISDGATVDWIELAVHDRSLLDPVLQSLGQRELQDNPLAHVKEKRKFSLTVV
jgi:hypothetical protein